MSEPKPKRIFLAKLTTADGFVLRIYESGGAFIAKCEADEYAIPGDAELGGFLVGWIVDLDDAKEPST